jgi:ParB-like chromosome segregation protein Spo0J
MKKMQIDYVNPESLTNNLWNPNKVDSANQKKLVNSLNKIGIFKPILVRTLPDKSLEIIGGQHRVEALISMGEEEIPIYNMGVISDEDAKRITLADNSQYGELDYEKFVDMVGNGEIGSVDEIISFLPMDSDEFGNIFDKSLDEINSLEMDLDNYESIDLEPNIPTKTKAFQVVRFKVAAEDAHIITDKINRIKTEQGFEGSDDLTNAGDALIHIFNGLNDV